ncbi:MAG: cell division protein ZapA [Spirochaetes bacterium]|nr:cell division protein ZapA [Spirochaetota bacterium]
MPEPKVKVEIFGNIYNIQGEAPPEYINKLAQYVDNKMSEVSRSLPSENVLHTAILAALNIADEYFQLKEIDEHADSVILKRANALISMLEEGIIGDVYSNQATKKTIAE